MKLTKVGKFLQRLRIDNDELLMDMSLKLGVTPSYISAIEIGKIELSDELREKIVRVYSLDKYSNRGVEKMIEKQVYKIGEIGTFTGAGTIETVLGRKLNIQKGDRFLVKDNKVEIVTGQAKGIIFLPKAIGIEVKGYDYENISKSIVNIFMDNYNFDDDFIEAYTEEVEDTLREIFE